MARMFGRTREWIGGVRALSVPVTGEGEPYHPLGLLWLDPKSRIVLGMSVEHPDKGLAYAAGHLLQVIDDPMTGKPGRPTRIRTASGALAEALASGLAGTRPPIEIVVAPTPEIDEPFDGLESMLAMQGEAPGWRDAGASVEAVAGYFDAVATLHVLAPWELVPNDEVLFRVDCPRLDVEDWVMSVIGQAGVSRGLLLFPDRATYDAFIDFAAMAEGLTPVDPTAFDALPEHMALDFEHRDTIPPDVVEEVRRENWRVAGDDAWPALRLFGAKELLRAPTERDLAFGEAVARAVTEAFGSDARALAAAIHETPHDWSYTGSVDTATGAVDVRLELADVGIVASLQGTRARGEPRREKSARDGARDSVRPRDAASLLDALRALQSRAATDGLDIEETQDLTEALLEHFRASPEAAPFEQPLQGPELLAQIAATHLDTTLPALAGQELDEALFEIAPRHMLAPPEIARNIVETTRALFVWLGREHALEQTDELIELLGEDAVRELERHLEDPAGPSPFQALASEMLAAGVDPADPKAVDDFMTSRLGTRPSFDDDDPFGDLDGFRPLSSEPTLTPEQRRTRQKKRKGNRKAARKARKKNR